MTLELQNLANMASVVTDEKLDSWIHVLLVEKRHREILRGLPEERKAGIVPANDSLPIRSDS